MKNKFYLTSILSVTIALSSVKADLLITGIVDGTLSGGTPKALELFALTNISDLSLYGVELVSNAGTSAGALESTFSSVSLAAGSFYYVSTASSADEFLTVFGFSPDHTTNDVNQNGDDDLYIYGPSGLLDVWGGSDGLINDNTDHDLTDSYAYRNNDVSNNISFTVSEWTVAGRDALDGLDAAGHDAAIPFGTYTNSAVPEPSTYALLSGLFGLIFVMLKRRQA
jgi:hypothetical protein